MPFDFLPTTKAEVAAKGWSSLDVILITGDAYVDHPAFGASLIGRYLEAQGFTVGIIAQPDWRSDADFLALGQPNLFFGVTAGNLDSMVANYTAEKRPRKTDDYSEDGVIGKRPDQAVLVYCNQVKKLFPKIPIIIGGIEASLRRLTYYDYWANKVRRSILLDSRADLLVYGMAEKGLLNAAQNLQDGKPLIGIKNTAYLTSQTDLSDDCLILPSFEATAADKQVFAQTVLEYTTEAAKPAPRRIAQACQNKFVLVEPPNVLIGQELDQLYTLPFTRKAHPRYKKAIPAFSFVKDSVVSHRGCYGGCSFCTLTLHQGKFIVSRSPAAILTEIETVLCQDADFKGNILDIGGPTSNMYATSCGKGCARLSCLVPQICPHLKADPATQLQLLTKALQIPGVKRIFLNSGIRHDLALKFPAYLEAIVKNHISGQMSLAPEHINSNVLRLMQKPDFACYERFLEQFNQLNKKHHKQQFAIPYFMASHPGTTLEDMYELAMHLRAQNLRVKQVQNFIPIPMSLASAMYYAEVDIFTGKPIHVAKGEERFLQRALMQPYLGSNLVYVTKALKILHKTRDLRYLTYQGD